LEESNVVIFSSDGTGGGVRLLDTGRPSTLSQVRFEGFGSADSLPAVVFSAADVIMEDCQLAEDGGRDLLMVVRGTLRMERVTMAGGRDQLTLAYVQAMLSDVLLNSAADEALVVHGGRTDMNNVRAIRTKGVGVKASNGAALQMDQCEVDAVGNGIELEKGSMLNAKGGSIRSGSTGIRAGKEEQRHGPCKVDIKGTAVEGGKAPFHVGKGADVKKDGNIVQADPGTAS
jgi:hypothetical protein